MRSLFLSATLALGALGLTAVSPAQAQAQWWNRWGYTSYYYPSYSSYYPSYSYSYYPATRVTTRVP
jgi:hypothetical protein